MAQLPLLRSDTEVARNTAGNLRERAGITHWGVDSIGRVLAEVVSQEVSRLGAESRRAFSALQLSEATGRELDDIGSFFNVARLLPTRANVADKHLNLHFYSTGGTFGDINSGSPINLTAGTIIRTKSRPGTDVIEYRLSRDYTLPINGTVAYVSADAVTIGSSQNVGDHVLRYHDFESYTEANKNILRCNNDYPILNGADEEKDDKYRFRIFNQIPSLVQNNKEAIQLKGLDLPGVKYVRVLPGYFGIGTTGVVVFGTDNETSEALRSAMFTRLTEIQGPSLKIVPLSGVRVYLDIEVKCLMSTQTTLDEQDSLTRSVRETIRSYITMQEFSRNISLDTIASGIVSEHSQIVGLIGREGVSSKFEAVYIRKAASGTEALEERRTVVGDLVRLEEEEHAVPGRVTVKFTTRR